MTLRTWLEAIHPGLFPIAIVLGLWVGQWATRRRFPQVWEHMADLPFGGALRDELTRLDLALRKVWQAVPSAAGGAILMDLSGGGTLKEALIGAGVGLLAPLVHETLKRLPGPYGVKQ